MKEMPPGSVHITPDKLRQIGVAFAQVEERPLVKEIRTVARVTYDETRYKEISLKFSGWVESVFVDFTGMSVRRGQPLFSLYSPDLVTAQEEYLLALPLRESSPSLLQAARRKLSLWDLSPAQIETLEVKGKAQRAMTVFSPVEGVVIEKRMVEGQFIEAGQTLYRIADISTLWLVAAVYEEDLPLLRVGQEAVAELSSAGQMIRGQVSYISPYLDGAARTAELRIAVPNHDLALRPEMYATVQVRVPLGERLAVPEDAVLDSGTSKRVFVDRGGKILEPREVRVGSRAGGYFEIVQGLKFGERVVAFANFLIDSESKLQAALGRSHSH
ncbi:MAG: efflux RND transporter periplasmic adaptor subunit [Candidatus Oleimicrobiaceae bacterium]